MTNRTLSACCVLAIAGLLLTSLYLQIYQNIMPCPLCSLQRVTFIFLSITYLAGVVFYKYRWQRLTSSLLSLLFASVGLLLAGRQVWLQHFPPAESLECGASLQYMMQVLPWNELLAKILAGTGDCSKLEWSFLKLDLAEWALISFSGFFLISLFMLLRDVLRSARSA